MLFTEGKDRKYERMMQEKTGLSARQAQNGFSKRQAAGLSPLPLLQ